MSKVAKIAKFVGFTILLLGIVGYLTYYVINNSGPDPDSVCVGVELLMEDDEVSPYISQEDVDKILNYAHLTPTGKLMKDIDTKDLERFVAKNPFVKEVSCYKSSTGKVIVKVVQRTPVIYILPDDKKGYFIDETGAVIPNVRYESNVIVASGKVDERYAKKELLPFALYLRSNTFWDNQVEQIYVSVDKRKKKVVELVPRVGNQIIYLGTIDNYRVKLKRLKVFYEKAVGIVGWNKYSKINLEYENQIICTKHKK